MEQHHQPLAEADLQPQPARPAVRAGHSDGAHPHGQALHPHPAMDLLRGGRRRGPWPDLSGPLRRPQQFLALFVEDAIDQVQWRQVGQPTHLLRNHNLRGAPLGVELHALGEFGGHRQGRVVHPVQRIAPQKPENAQADQRQREQPGHEIGPHQPGAEAEVGPLTGLPAHNRPPSGSGSSRSSPRPGSSCAGGARPHRGHWG